jgi:DNA-binding transcriptional LysR family regulator
MDSLVEGRGFALLPIWAVAAELAEGRLQAIDLEDGPLSTSGDTRMAVYLIYHPPKFRLQKVKVTADFLIAELRRETFNF